MFGRKKSSNSFYAVFACFISFDPLLGFSTRTRKKRKNEKERKETEASETKPKKTEPKDVETKRESISETREKKWAEFGGFVC